MMAEETQAAEVDVAAETKTAPAAQAEGGALAR